MAYIRLPAGIRVAMEYEVFGKVVVNVYHVTTTDPIITVKLLDIAQVFADWWSAQFNNSLSQDIALTAVTALNLDVANGEKQTLVISPPVDGDSPNPAVPNNVAIVASFGTGLTGRSYRGRAYHAGLTENTVTGNEISSALASLLIGYYGVLQTDLAAENALLVVASFYSGGLPRATGVATEVESVSMNLRVDTQRRRLPK